MTLRIPVVILTAPVWAHRRMWTAATPLSRDDYFIHSASAYYYGDVWTIGFGVRNVFNQEPPRVDPGENFESLNSIGNVPIGYGYDLNGRTYFLNVQAKFANFQ